MAGSPFLRRQFYHQITRVKLLNGTNDSVRFQLEKSPFVNGNDGDTGEFMISGTIHLPSAPKRIEIRWKNDEYPHGVPSIKFHDEMNHPEVKKNGEISAEFLKTILNYTSQTTLVDIIQAIFNNIDEKKREPEPTPKNTGSIEFRAEVFLSSIDMIKKSALSQHDRSYHQKSPS